MAAYDIHYPNPPPAKEYEVGVVVLVWNRVDYLRRFLRHLKKSALPNALLVFVDDGSVDRRATDLLREFEHPQAPAIKCYAQRHEHFQFHRHLRFAWDLLADVYGCRYLTNFDPDVIMRSDWLERVRNVYERERAKRFPLLVSGFNKYTGITLEAGADYNVRRFLGGAHMFFEADTYRRILRSKLLQYWDDHVVEAIYAQGGACLTTKPSCVQHIGRRGVFASPFEYDRAIDYSFGARFDVRAYALLAKRCLVDIENVYRKAASGNCAWVMNRNSKKGE